MKHVQTKPVYTNAMTVSNAKFHCRIDGTYEDGYIPGLIASAYRFCESETGRCLFTQVRELWLPEICARYLELSDPPLASVDSIKVYDASDTDSTVDPSDYRYYKPSENCGIIEFLNIPSSGSTRLDAIRIRYTAGYTALPEDIVVVMYLLIDLWHKNRTAETERNLKALEYGVDRMSGHYKVFTEDRWIQGY